MVNSPRRVKYVVVAIAIASFAVNLVVTAANKPETRAGAELSIMAARPPVQVAANGQTVSLKRLDTATTAGNALVIVQSSARDAGGQFKLSTVNGTFLFRDDGAGGDERANDGRFSSLMTVDFKSLAEDQQAFQRDVIAADGNTKVPVFDGRVVIGGEALELPGSGVELRAGEEIVLRPMALPAGIDPARSLLITDPKVIEDPTRTFNPCTGVGTPMGKWTFGYLMQQMANQPVTGIDPSAFVRKWLAQWESNQTPNGWDVPPRPSVRDTVIIPWEIASGGLGAPLDLSKAPFRLLAIVNRIDLRGSGGYQTNSAGEARFVFGVIDRRPNPQGCCFVSEMSVILEYGIDRKGCLGVKSWAQQWVNLSSLPLGSAAYNAALEAITEQFAKAGAAPGKVNGSALNQLRTNEFLPPQTGPWELREFKLTPGREDPFVATGALIETTVKQTPDEVLNNRPTLRNYINANCGPLAAGTHVVPLNFPRDPADAGLPNSPRMLGGNAFVPPSFWNAAGITCGPIPPGDARFQFSFATCSGCHLAETATAFYHIRPTQFGTPPALSAFLSGPITVFDPVTGTPRNFDEMNRRAIILLNLARQICPLPFPEIVLRPIKFLKPEEAIIDVPNNFTH